MVIQLGNLESSSLIMRLSVLENCLVEKSLVWDSGNPAAYPGSAQLGFLLFNLTWFKSLHTFSSDVFL